MNPVRQVVHVLRKDLRQQLWFAAGFLILAVGAVLRVGGLAVPVVATEFGTFSMVLLAMLAAAAAVQGDAPTDPTNFWATRPIDPRAVLGAKLALGALLLGVAVVAQWSALALVRTPLGEVAEFTIPGALSLAQWVIGAMVLGAVMRDLKSLAIALPLAVIGGVLATALLDAPLRMILVMTGPALKFLWPVAALALLGWLFLTRDTSWYIRAAGTVLMALVPVTLMVPDLGFTIGRLPAPADDAPRITGSVILPDSAARRAGVSGFDLRVRVHGARPGWKFRLTRAEMVLTLADGRVVRAGPTTDLHDLTPDAVTSGEVFIPVPMPAVREAVVSGVREVVLQGDVTASELRVVDTLPWRRGASAARDGVRVTIGKIAGTGDEPRLGVRVGMLVRDRSYFIVGRGGGLRDWRVILVNRRTGEVVPLRSFTSEVGPFGLVLPERNYQEVYAEYQIPDSTPNATRIDDAWLREAGVVVQVERGRGSYPVVWGSR